ACQYIADRLYRRGNVVILSGPSVSSIADRIAGCRAKLDAIPGIQVLSADRNGGGSSEGAFIKMTDILTQFPRIDAVFAINDPTALGVEEAALQAKRNEFFIVGIDGAPRVKARMREVDSLIVATVAQMPDVLAQKAVESGYALMQKRPLPEPVVLIPPELLTHDSLPDSSDWSR
ncbi:MAG: substrate-binding domain-containing protein, partial [Propionivibrio sp.]